MSMGGETVYGWQMIQEGCDGPNVVFVFWEYMRYHG